MRLRDNVRKAMLAIKEQWQKSGLRQKDFYLQQNIAAHVFYYWLKCFKKQQTIKVDKQLPKAGSFIQLQPLQIASVNTIEIRLPNGIQILFNSAVSVDYLKALTSQ